jgi:MFS family permease
MTGPDTTQPDTPFDRPDTSRTDLRLITGDGVAFSLMVGVGETYVPAFALVVGMSETAAGCIVTIPLLAGAVIQLVSPAAISRLGSLKVWVVLCAVVQALSMLAYAAIAITEYAPASLLFLVATVYWAAGLATGPAWNTWVGTLVPHSLRARFFAQRSRFAHFAVFCGLVGGGIALHFGEGGGFILRTFAVLFGLAGLARLVSAGMLGCQSEPVRPIGRQTIVPLGDWMRRWRHSNDGRLLLYMLAVQGAVQISGPYFVPYMLGELELNYLHYLVLIGTSFLTKMLVLPFVGRIVHRFGPRAVLIAAGIGIIPLSALWVISDSFVFLLSTQVLSGGIWAVYELTTFLLFFEHIDEKERTSVLTTYNLAHAIMTVIGAVIGAVILKAMAEGHAGYMVLFALSGGLRLLAIPLLLRVGRIPVRHYAISTRSLGVRPNSGSIDVPIVTSLEDEHADEAALVQK